MNEYTMDMALVLAVLYILAEIHISGGPTVFWIFRSCCSQQWVFTLFSSMAYASRKTAKLTQPKQQHKAPKQVLSLPSKVLLGGLCKQSTVSLTDFIFSPSLFFFSLKITFNIYFPAVYKLTSSTHKSRMLCFFKLQAE